MGGHQSGIEGRSITRAGGGVRPPVLSPPRDEETPVSVQSALGAVRPDDMDAIFDDALFGAPKAEAIAVEAAFEPGPGAPVAVGSVEWFLERDAQPAGPFRLERLRELWHHGSLSPDTLCWCEAWSQWRPLSSVPELVAALTDAGLPTVVADAAPAPAKQEEAKVVPALPALVAEEEAWLRKVHEEKEQAKEEARSAMLDTSSAPASEPVLPPHFAPLPVPPAPPVPVVAPVPVPVPVAPAVIPALVMPEAPVAPEPERKGKGLVVGTVIGATAVGLAMGALLLLPQLRSAPARVPEAAPRPVAVAPETPRQAAPAPVAVTPPPPAPQPAPAAPQPSAPVVAAAPTVQPAPAPVAPQPPAPVAPVVVKQETKVVTASVQVPAPAVSEPPRKVAAVAPVVREKPPVVEAERITRVVAPPPAPAPVSKPKVGKAVADDTPAADPSNFEDSVDKAFEKELFDGPKAEDPRSKRNVYVPPEPGKETLSTSDVMQVVGSHKDGILSCIEAHEPPRDPETDKGRFVLRWRVQTNGTATDVLMETESLKGTAFARCMEGQVRSWKFPQHRVQSREPVRFPFTY